MRLVQTLYYSRPSPGVTMTDVDDILRVARERNAQQAITGALLFRQDLFVQVLEGERSAVSEVLTGIVGDPRHHDVVLVGAREITRRDFADWSMAHVSLTEDSVATVLRHSPTADLDPSTLGFEALLGLVYALTEEASAVPVGS